MTPTEFIHFLDGFLSSNPNLEYLNEAQTKIIKEKLSTVFNKVTPNVLTPTRFPQDPTVPLTTFPSPSFTTTTPYWFTSSNPVTDLLCSSTAPVQAYLSGNPPRLYWDNPGDISKKLYPFRTYDTGDLLNIIHHTC